MLSESGRKHLLAIARRAIEERLRGRALPTFEGLTEELRQNCGAFVTLRRRSDRGLRGCVGYVEPRYPLAEAVALAAVAAATADGRFDPVTLEELGLLALDVSVLGPAFPIEVEDVVVGRHGVIVECAGRRGLLLPQVALEWGWDAALFLEQACRKASLPHDAWRHPETRLFAFEAEVLGED